MASAAVALCCMELLAVGLTTAVMPGASTHILDTVRVRTTNDVSPVR